MTTVGMNLQQRRLAMGRRRRRLQALGRPPQALRCCAPCGGSAARRCACAVPTTSRRCERYRWTHCCACCACCTAWSRAARGGCWSPAIRWARHACGGTRACWCWFRGMQWLAAADQGGSETLRCVCCPPWSAAHGCSRLLALPPPTQERNSRAKSILVSVEAAAAALHLVTVPDMPARGGSTSHTPINAEASPDCP
jgi:hypothetical protein